MEKGVDMGKILLCEFGGLGEDGIERAFLRIGYEVERIRVKADNYDYDKTLFRTILSRMQVQDVDLVFSINFMPLVSKVCNIYHILYLSWIYDSPELHLYSPAIYNPVNRIFLFDRIQYERFYAVSPETVYYLPLATEPLGKQVLRGITEEEHRRYDSEVCFMGSLYTEKYKYWQVLDRLPDYWKGFITGIVEAQVNVFGYNFIQDSLRDEDVRELLKWFQFELIDDYRRDDREIFSDFMIGPLVSILDRKRTLQRLSEQYPVTLYTGSDTKELPHIDNRGEADSITMMPKIFHCSKVNLNITSKTIQSGIPQRVFDVLGAEGFLITNFQAELPMYFEPGVDLVVYEDMDDLEEKVGYYLSHEEERRRIAEHGYQTVCNCYTYDLMLGNMLRCALGTDNAKE